MIDITIDQDEVDQYVEIVRWTVVTSLRSTEETIPLIDVANASCHLLTKHYDRGSVRFTFLSMIRDAKNMSEDGRFTMRELLELHCKEPLDSQLPDVESHVEKYLPCDIKCSLEDIVRWAVVFIYDILSAPPLREEFDRKRLHNMFTSHEPNEVALAFDFCRFALLASMCAVIGHPLPQWSTRSWQHCGETEDETT